MKKVPPDISCCKTGLEFSQQDLRACLSLSFSLYPRLSPFPLFLSLFCLPPFFFFLSALPTVFLSLSPPTLITSVSAAGLRAQCLSSTTLPLPLLPQH